MIGGFDFDRGGEESLIPSENATLSAEISSAFPGATFQFTSELTPQFFSGIQVAIFGVATAPRSSVNPLTTSEQSALLNFVLGGGTALIFADNTGYSAESPTTNASFLSPFGVTMTGNLGGVLTAPLVNPTGPLTGPYPAQRGLWKLPRILQRYRTGDGAGQLRRGRAGRRLSAPGVLGPHSGTLVLFADSDALFAGDPVAAMDLNLILNAIDSYQSSVPEPSTWVTMLLGVGGVGVAVYLKKRRGAALAFGWSSR